MNYLDTNGRMQLFDVTGGIKEIADSSKEILRAAISGDERGGHYGLVISGILYGFFSGCSYDSVISSGCRPAVLFAKYS